MVKKVLNLYEKVAIILYEKYGNNNPWQSIGEDNRKPYYDVTDKIMDELDKANKNARNAYSNPNEYKLDEVVEYDN